MKKWIEKAYRPAGFILLGALAGSGLTLAIQGKLSTPYVVLGLAWVCALGILVVNGYRNKTLYFLAASLFCAGNATAYWMREKPLGGIVFSVLALIYAYSTWTEHNRLKEKRAKTIVESI
jgi:hypothetical protein